MGIKMGADTLYVPSNAPAARAVYNKTAAEQLESSPTDSVLLDD